MQASIASGIGSLFQQVAAFNAFVTGLEAEIGASREVNPEHRALLAQGIEDLMGTAVEVEHTVGPLAPDLLHTTQDAFRRLTSDVFCRSRMIERALRKPRGYAGDHALLDIYYTRDHAEAGFDRVLDAWAHDAPASRAVVARKDYVKQWVASRVAKRSCAKVVDLACGPCRLERDLFDAGRVADAHLVLADNDPEALAYARRVLGVYADHVTFVEENAIKIARQRVLPPSLSNASFVVSLGLFDYLPRILAVSLLRALRQGSAPGGELLVGNFAKGNPTAPFMEWAADWRLIYRSDEEFLQMFLDAGFAPEDLSCEREAEDGLVLMVTARVP
jgi:SAM-dependent methyltransferase